MGEEGKRRGERGWEPRGWGPGGRGMRTQREASWPTTAETEPPYLAHDGDHLLVNHALEFLQGHFEVVFQAKTQLGGKWRDAIVRAWQGRP